MKTSIYLLFVLLLSGGGDAQVADTKAAPQVKTLIIEEDAVTTVRLSPGYTTSIRLPEDVSSVVVGNPANFKAEHVDAEPRLVFLKPITSRSAESNALITTRSGQEISLHLISGGQAASQPRVDFLLEYRRPQSLLINSDAHSFFISETKPVPPSENALPAAANRDPDIAGEVLAAQKAVASPRWDGNDLQVAVGESMERDHQTILAFSVLNNSKRTIELLPPQIALSGVESHGNKRPIRAEPIAITDYRMTSRRLAPGERADGVAIFERPSFKESGERLELQVAESGQVDHPIRVAVPFVASTLGGVQ